MTSLQYHCILIFLFVPFCLLAQFEGEIEMSTTSAVSSEKATMTWSMKADQHLMEISSTSPKMKMDYALFVNEGSQEAWFLSQNGGQSAAYKVPYTNLSQSQMNIPLNGTFKKTEETKSISGFSCQKYTIISSTHIIECWISDDTGLTHSDFPSFMSTGDLLGILKLNHVNGIPVSWEMKDTAGNVVLGQYLNKVTSKSIPDSTFDISSYEKNNAGQ